ncbi:MAG: hypothetical protein ACI92I_000857 [Acidimicrobiales bacterium]|jgi:hypothetical protein
MGSAQTLEVEQMPGMLKLPKGSIVYLGTQGFEDELVPLAKNGGWVRLRDTWTCFPGESIFRRDPGGLGMTGYSIITPWDVKCVALYDSRPFEKFPEYIRKLFPH